MHVQTRRVAPMFLKDPSIINIASLYNKNFRKCLIYILNSLSLNKGMNMY